MLSMPVSMTCVIHVVCLYLGLIISRSASSYKNAT